MRTGAKTTIIYARLNRRGKKKKRAITGLFLIKYVVFILVFVLTGLIYAKQRNMNVLLGYKVQKLEKEMNVLDADKLRLESELLRTKSPDNLNHLIRKHNLTFLQHPEDGQIVRLGKPEPLRFSSAPTPKGSAHKPFPKKGLARMVRR